MQIKRSFYILSLLIGLLFASGCRNNQPAAATSTPKILAVETFLADIAQNVAGDRLKVESLIPLNMDPHAFIIQPSDMITIANTNVLIINGGGLESWLEKTLQNAGGTHQVIDASQGLTSRIPQPSESDLSQAQEHSTSEIDPHFWLDPVQVIQYVENIRDGLIQADPGGKDLYTSNADQYIQQLKDLDQWIKDQVSLLPPEKRILVTNHESFGYFADRYGFQVVGTIVPSANSDSAPSAQQLAHLVDQIKQYSVQAIFLETDSNNQLAEQIAQETGITVITRLYSHSITPANGDAPTYIDMMKYNTLAIIEALQTP